MTIKETYTSSPFDNENIRESIRQHAAREYPKECCGVIISLLNTHQYFPCRNDSEDPTEEFKINSEDMTDAMDLGELYAIVHSHPDASSMPSPYDKAKMSRIYQSEKMLDENASPIPWIILSWPEGDFREVVAEDFIPLVGRQFIHGLYDCWQACADYYYRAHGLVFPDFNREDKWWEDKEGISHYEHWYPESGFRKINMSEILPGDLIVMQIGRSYHPNHAAVYLGNKPILPHEDLNIYGQGPFMLHHMYGRKSAVEIYGGQWFERTSFVLRHKDINNV